MHPYKLRWSITTLTRAELIPLLCTDCGTRLDSDVDAVLFVCPACGLTHEPAEGGFRVLPTLVASVTSRSVATDSTIRLAVWRLVTDISSAGAVFGQDEPSAAARRGSYVYVPAFSLARMVVENLGVRLTQKQPVLEAPSGALSGGAAVSSTPFSPILLGREEARLLAGFVHLGLGVREGQHEEMMEDELTTSAEELVFVPAVRDPRCVHDAGWRLLLREFDD